MTYHSDYYTYGFQTSEVAAFLAKHGIHIQAEEAGITQSVSVPKWAMKYRGLKSFKLTWAAEIMIGVDPSASGCLSGEAQADFDIAVRLLEQAIEDEILKTGKDRDGYITVFDTQLRAWCRSIGRVWCIPEVDPLPDATTDEALLQSLQEVQREKAELVKRLSVFQDQHDERECLKQRVSALVKDVTRLEAERAALHVELESLRADALAGKNKTTLLTLLGGLAMNNGMLIHASRLDGIGALVGELARHGVSVTDDTVRLHLRAAAELIPKPK